MSLRNHLNDSAGLLSSLEAVRNLRAAALLLASLVLAGLAFALGGVLSFKVHALVGMLFVLLGIAIAFYGGNGAGIMLMDEARGGQSRPVASAVLASLATGHRLLAVVLLIVLAYLLGLLAMAIMLFLCKIPGLGAFLFTFVFPVCVVVAGIAVFAFYAVVLPLAAPAIWAGATAMQSISRLAAIARARTVGVVLSMMVLMIIVFAAAAIVFGIMGFGTLIAGGLSAAIVGMGGVSIASLMSGMGSGVGEGGSYATAGALGGGVVWAMAFTLPALVYVRGCCQVYLANLQGVDAEAVEQKMRSSFDAARRKAEEIRAHGDALVSAPRAPAGARPLAGSGPASVAAAGCPACGAACAPDDLFCGSCGHRMS